MPLSRRRERDFGRGSGMQTPNTYRGGPDERGHFGLFGGRFVAETLMPLILELEKAYARAKVDPEFKREMDYYLAHYVGRPSPLYFAERLTDHLREISAATGGAGGAQIYFQRDELNHPGSDNENNGLGQNPVAELNGQPRVIDANGTAQHGAATATLCWRTR